MQIVPDHWLESVVEVVSVSEDEDHLCSFVGPIRNRDSLDVITKFPDDLLDAIEDYYLANVSYNMNWKQCVFRLSTLDSGSKYVSAKPSYD